MDSDSVWQPRPDPVAGVRVRRRRCCLVWAAVGLRRCQPLLKRSWRRRRRAGGPAAARHCHCIARPGAARTSRHRRSSNRAGGPRAGPACRVQVQAAATDCTLASSQALSARLACQWQADIQVRLMVYSTFEVLDLPCSGPMGTRRVVKLYKPFTTPILYVGGSGPHLKCAGASGSAKCPR